MSTKQYCAVLLSFLLLGAGEGRAQAASPPSPTEIQAGRQQLIQEILTDDLPGAARWARSGCAFEDAVASVAKARAEGHIMAPDAGEGCIAAMTRQAHDGGLIALYQDTLNLAVGNYADAPQLPSQIIAAIQSGSNKVDLGGGHILTVTPGLALDVGFTAAYENKGAGISGTVKDPAKLKAVTENCVGQREDVRACFTVGYIQGAAAYSTAHPAS